MSQKRLNLNTSAYQGVYASTPPEFVTHPRAPTVNDYKDWYLGTFWLHKDGTTHDLWTLVGKEGCQGEWIKLLHSTAPLFGVGTLTGNVGGPISPDAFQNINIVGSGPYIITGNPATWTLTLSDDGTIPTQFDTDAGSGVASGNIINIVGGSYIDTSAVGDTITIDFTGDLAFTYITDAGNAVPILNELQVLGGLNINTSGAANVVTINTDNFGLGVLQSDALGVVTGSVGTDGQVLISATAGTPTWANITSSGGTITVTDGPNSINLEAAAGPGFVNAGDNININPVNTVNLNETIHWPVTNALGTTGAIYLGGAGGVGGTLFMHNYGPAAPGGNTFLGWGAGNLTTTGQNMVGVGEFALSSVTSGNNNTAFGGVALMNVTTGDSNIGIGDASSVNVTTGDSNITIGAFAASNMVTGYENVLIGTVVGNQLISGYHNTIVGHNGFQGTGNMNTGFGYKTLYNIGSGTRNVCIGYVSGYGYTGTESANVLLGTSGTAGDNNTMRLGAVGAGPAQITKCYIAGIHGVTVSSSTTVYINANGQLGTISSSERYKDNIRDMGDHSSPILDLEPVIFEYKNFPGVMEFGLIAEEVNEVMPSIVIKNDDGSCETVQYHKLIPMLLNEVKKLRDRIEVLENR